MVGTLFLSVPGILSAKEKTDTLILNRIYRYQKEHKKDIKGLEDNIYVKCRYNVEKRNRPSGSSRLCTHWQEIHGSISVSRTAG